MRLTVATHNMHDTGTAKRLGALIGWTEVNYRSVKALAGMRHRRPARAPKGLAVSWDADIFRARKVRPVTVHGGEAKFTPARGFLVLRGNLRNAKKTRVVFVVTHLINNAFGPVKRPRRLDRVRLWLAVTNRLKRKIRRWERKGFVVIVVGDFNRRDYDFLPPLEDTRTRRQRATLDRIFVSGEVKVRRAHSGPKYGSDHHSEVAHLDI